MLNIEAKVNPINFNVYILSSFIIHLRKDSSENIKNLYSLSSKVMIR